LPFVRSANDLGGDACPAIIDPSVEPTADISAKPATASSPALALLAGPKKPPRSPIELIQAKLAAAAIRVRNIDGNLQNPPLMPQSPIAAIDTPPRPRGRNARPFAASQAAD